MGDAKDIDWYAPSGEKILSDRQDIFVSRNDDSTSTLTIYHAKVDSAGIYKCVAKNGDKEAQATVQVKIFRKSHFLLPAWLFLYIFCNDSKSYVWSQTTNVLVFMYVLVGGWCTMVFLWSRVSKISKYEQNLWPKLMFYMNIEIIHVISLPVFNQTRKSPYGMTVPSSFHKVWIWIETWIWLAVFIYLSKYA